MKNAVAMEGELVSSGKLDVGEDGVVRGVITFLVEEVWDAMGWDEGDDVGSDELERFGIGYNVEVGVVEEEFESGLGDVVEGYETAMAMVEDGYEVVSRGEEGISPAVEGIKLVELVDFVVVDLEVVLAFQKLSFVKRLLTVAAAEACPELR